jgi:hypothetical protein
MSLNIQRNCNPRIHLQPFAGGFGKEDYLFLAAPKLREGGLVGSGWLLVPPARINSKQPTQAEIKTEIRPIQTRK